MTIRKPVASIAAALSLLLFAYTPIACAQNPYRAATAAGEVEGLRADGMRVFKGIPYAAPPVGNLRWRAPQAPTPWHGAFRAYEFGHACPQTASKDVPLTDMSEDCLTLNVWSPARDAGAKLPVMVWLHGGAFETGSARMPIYDGTNLAHRGVVRPIVNRHARLLSRRRRHAARPSPAAWRLVPGGRPHPRQAILAHIGERDVFVLAVCKQE